MPPPVLHGDLHIACCPHVVSTYRLRAASALTERQAASAPTSAAAAHLLAALHSGLITCLLLHPPSRSTQDYELPPNVNATTSAAEALAGAQFAIHAVPVQHTRAFLQGIKVRCLRAELEAPFRGRIGGDALLRCTCLHSCRAAWRAALLVWHGWWAWCGAACATRPALVATHAGAAWPVAPALQELIPPTLPIVSAMCKACLACPHFVLPNPTNVFSRS